MPAEHDLARLPEWRQSTPRDQLVAILGAALGLTNNAAQGIYSEPAVIQAKMLQLEALLEQAVSLTQFVNGVWPPEHNRSEPH